MMSGMATSRVAQTIPILVILLMTSPLRGQTIYNTEPDWISADTPVSTGGALVDLNQDGWTDFVVGNGNDIYSQQLVVYYNNGDGTLPPSPNWFSSDAGYNGHLSIADVNGDGWMDVGVGLSMQDAGTATARVYFNNAGTLSSLPDWESPDELSAFHVAFGDVNGDGRPDLVVATGWPWDKAHLWHNQVYLNVGGTLESSPSWVSDDTWDLGDGFFCDVNGDGWLDLVGVGAYTNTWVYINDEGTLATTATWHTTDNSDQLSFMGTYGDVNGDGWYELFTTDIASSLFAPGGAGRWAALLAAGQTTRLSSSGYLRRYDGLPGGFFTTTPTWTYFDGNGSAVALADIDADADLDLLCGSWWGQTHYFLNTDGLYPSRPDWSSSGTSVVEAICLGDVDNDGLRLKVETFDVASTPGGHLFRLAHQPIERIEHIAMDGSPLSPDAFTFDPVHGWVSVGPEASTSVTVEYLYSIKPDMAVTNWDDTLGNYLYYNQSDAAMGDFDGDGDVDLDDFAEFTSCFTGPDGGPVTPECAPGDIDADDDIDCADWNKFILAWTGPDDPPDFVECPALVPPAPEPGGPECVIPEDCTGAWAGADCVSGYCYVPKNRYLSVDPTTNEASVALQIVLTEAADYPTAVGRTWWVEGPVCYDYPDGNPVIPPPATCDEGPTRYGWVSKLTSTPVTRVWTESPLHISDCGVVPVVNYEIRATHPDEGVTFSDPLVINTAHNPEGDTQSWGDVTGGPVPGMPGLWLPPERATNLADVGNAIRTFENRSEDTGFPPRIWVDMETDQVINLGDISFIVMAFEGRAYADIQLELIGIDPADCP